MGRETEAQSILDYFLQNKSKYKPEEIQEFKTEFLEFEMNEEDSKNLKSMYGEMKISDDPEILNKQSFK